MPKTSPSSEAPGRLYVWSDLGGELQLVGAVQCVPRKIGEFQYARSFLGGPRPFSINPVMEPLRADPFAYLSVPFLPGALLDAGPDDWGRRTLQHLGRSIEGLAPLALGEGTGVGCLLFSGSRDQLKPRRTPPALAEIESLARGVSHVEQGVNVPADIALLLAGGTSLGGARPKASVTDAGRTWLAKFPSSKDAVDQPALEYASLALARKLGITVPDHRLIDVGGRRVLLVARFDIDPDGRRKHYLSMASLLTTGMRLRESDLAGSQSYMGLSRTLATIGGGAQQQDRVELFRRATYNLLLGHVDDHARNHGVLLDDVRAGTYRLAPAFDIAPSNGTLESIQRVSPVQAIGIGAEGGLRTRGNLLSRTRDFGLTTTAGEAVVDELVAGMSQWRDHFATAGVVERDLDAIAHRVLDATALKSASRPVISEEPPLPAPGGLG